MTVPRSRNQRPKDAETKETAAQTSPAATLLLHRPRCSWHCVLKLRRCAPPWTGHHELVERLRASYACVLQSFPFNSGAAQSLLSLRAPPFHGRISQSSFQGTNPTTDFRSVGLLRLHVQLVFLGEHHKELVHVLMSLLCALSST